MSRSKWFDPTLEEVGKETTGFNDDHIPIPDLEDRTIRYVVIKSSTYQFNSLFAFLKIFSTVGPQVYLS